MFNELQKKEYLAESNKSERSLTLYNALFKKTEPYENKLQKDACNFIKEEIEDLLISFGAGATTSLATYLSMLTAYTDWCCTHQLSIDNINHYGELSNSMLSNYVNHFIYGERFITRDEVLEVINLLDYNKDKFVLLGLFEGLGGQNFCELTELKEEDINTETGEFKLVTGKPFVASEELVKIALQSAKTYDETRARVTYQDVTNVIKPRVNAVNENPIHKQSRIRNSISSIRRTMGKSITALKLHKSGFLYELLLLMDKNDWSFDDAFSKENYESKDMQDLIRKFDYNKAPKYQVKHIYAAAFRSNPQNDEI